MPIMKSYDESLVKIEKELKFLKTIQHGIDVALGNTDDAVPVEIDGRTVFIEKKDFSMNARLKQAQIKADEHNRRLKEEREKEKNKSDIEQ